MSPSRVMRRAVLLAAGTSLLLAGPASAHPFIQGGEAPVDSLAELTLDLAHGCASETAGEGDPTTEVALEVPEWMRIVDVPEPDGWSVTLEPDDVEVEVVTWANPDSDVPAPELTFEAVVSGDPGDERFLAVFQACDDFSYRWIGTPDEPADDPAIRLRLVAADPDRPAPPEPEPEPEPESAAPDTDDEGDDATDAADESDDAEEVTDRDDEVAADDGVDAEVDAEALADPQAAASEGISTTPIIVAVIVLVLGGIVAVVLTRRRNAGADA
jgi:uncharacterized protein YcnI